MMIDDAHILEPPTPHLMGNAKKPQTISHCWSSYNIDEYLDGVHCYYNLNVPRNLFDALLQKLWYGNVSWSLALLFGYDLKLEKIILVPETSLCKKMDYKEAARIRDSLRLFEEEEPVLRLRRLLKEAIAEERFQDAAMYRDELNEISPHSLLKCSSDATTLGIRVQVRSVYIEGRSQPSKGLYFFAYRIRIINNSDRPVQLLRRHWIITDANGKTENVWGIGVIGEQPVILPRTGFEYSSACPLSTSSGRMDCIPYI
ncbi:uncharacterized protein LOC141634878 [Silene latifolia]|uniref:uncharacterized protein LOC141634878 n=1 Tax=Silene latifolia TaxID=37657 RepID=UPI003D786F32